MNLVKNIAATMAGLFISHSAFGVTAVCQFGAEKVLEVCIDDNFKTAKISDIIMKYKYINKDAFYIPCTKQSDNSVLCEKFINLGRHGILGYATGIDTAGNVFFHNKFYGPAGEQTTKYNCTTIID